MRRFILKRLGSMVVTLWLLATIVFLLVNVLPGDVGRKVLGPTAKAEDVAAYNALTRHRQAADRAVRSDRSRTSSRFDFGDSFQTRSPVIDLLLPGARPLGEARAPGVRDHDPDLDRRRHLRRPSSGQAGRPGGRQRRPRHRRRFPSSSPPRCCSRVFAVQLRGAARCTPTSPAGHGLLRPARVPAATRHGHGDLVLRLHRPNDACRRDQPPCTPTTPARRR